MPRTCSSSSSHHATNSLIDPDQQPRLCPWGDVFGDRVVPAAMIDRIVHHAEVITLRGISTSSRTPASPHNPPQEPRTRRNKNHRTCPAFRQSQPAYFSASVDTSTVLDALPTHQEQAGQPIDKSRSLSERKRQANPRIVGPPHLRPASLELSRRRQRRQLGTGGCHLSKDGHPADP